MHNLDTLPDDVWESILLKCAQAHIVQATWMRWPDFSHLTFFDMALDAAPPVVRARLPPAYDVIVSLLLVNRRLYARLLRIFWRDVNAVRRGVFSVWNALLHRPDLGSLIRYLSTKMRYDRTPLPSCMQRLGHPDSFEKFIRPISTAEAPTTEPTKRTLPRTIKLGHYSLLDATAHVIVNILSYTDSLVQLEIHASVLRKMALSRLGTQYGNQFDHLTTLSIVYDESAGQAESDCDTDGLGGVLVCAQRGLGPLPSLSTIAMDRLVDLTPTSFVDWGSVLEPRNVLHLGNQIRALQLHTRAEFSGRVHRMLFDLAGLEHLTLILKKPDLRSDETCHFLDQVLGDVIPKRLMKQLRSLSVHAWHDLIHEDFYLAPWAVQPFSWLKSLSDLHTLHLPIATATVLLGTSRYEGIDHSKQPGSLLPPRLVTLGFGAAESDFGYLRRGDAEQWDWSWVPRPTTLWALPATLRCLRLMPLGDALVNEFEGNRIHPSRLYDAVAKLDAECAKKNIRLVCAPNDENPFDRLKMHMDLHQPRARHLPRRGRDVYPKRLPKVKASKTEKRKHTRNRSKRKRAKLVSQAIKKSVIAC